MSKQFLRIHDNHYEVYLSSFISLLFDVQMFYDLWTCKLVQIKFEKL